MHVGIEQTGLVMGMKFSEKGGGVNISHMKTLKWCKYDGFYQNSS